MELKINLATASLKDAEHAIFLIGAYFGLTQATIGDLRVMVPAQDVSPHGTNGITAAVLPHTDDAAPVVPLAADPAATFGATPPALPPGAGETPDASDAAQVFAGNAVTAPVGSPAIPTAEPSVPSAAAPGAGDVGNVVWPAGAAVAPVGSPLPVTPPAAPAPSAAPTAAPVGVDLDADGLPWDGRIHSSGEGGAKPKNADGRWRKRRGVQPLTVSQVEHELRAVMSATPAPAAQAPAVVPVPPVPTAPPAASFPPAPGVAPSADVAPPTTFEQLMPRVTAGVVAGKVPGNALPEACKAYGLSGTPMLANRPDLVPTIWAYLQSLYPDLA